MRVSRVPGQGRDIIVSINVVGLLEKVTREQRLKGSEVVSCVAFKDESVPDTA